MKSDTLNNYAKKSSTQQQSSSSSSSAQQQQFQDEQDFIQLETTTQETTNIADQVQIKTQSDVQQTAPFYSSIKPYSMPEDSPFIAAFNNPNSGTQCTEC